MSSKPPKIETKQSMGPASPRSRALTFGSTSEKAASQRSFTIPESANSNNNNNNDEDSKDNNSANKQLATTLENLSVYLDWRNAKFSKDDINGELWKIALTIWDFLPPSEPLFYRLNFNEAKKHNITTHNRPPIRVTTSMTGDILYCFYSSKQYIDYTDTCTILVYMPYIDSISMKGVSNWETVSKNDRCKWWEIERLTVTHIGFDKDDHIYFTNGESVYRIMSLGAQSGEYRMTHEEIWSVDGDTSHITSLWRQGDQLYFTSQDWEKEDELNLFKVKYRGAAGNSSTRAGGVASPTSPNVRSRPGSARSDKRYRSPSFGDGGSGRNTPRSPGRSPSNDNDVSISKVRTFSLEYNDRVYQLAWLRYEKKFLLGIAACRGGTTPQLMQISFKKQLKLVTLGSKHYTWPKPYEDTIPHDFIYHRPTRTWLLFLPVFSTKDGKDPSKNKSRYWIQFRLDASKKKVIWHRLVPLPENLIDGAWCHYDEIRDVLIGWQETNEKEKYYTLKYLPDLSKLLWVDIKESDKPDMNGSLQAQSVDVETSVNSDNKAQSTKAGSKTKKKDGSKQSKSAKNKGARRPAKSAAMPATVSSTKNKKKDKKQKGFSKTDKKNNKKKDKSKSNTAKANATIKSKTPKKDTIVDDELD